MTDTTLSPSPSERAEQVIENLAGVPLDSPILGSEFMENFSFSRLIDRITSEITAAERAAEARGAERMRERCVEATKSAYRQFRCLAEDAGDDGAHYEADHLYHKADAAASIATTLAALPLEEGEE